MSDASDTLGVQRGVTVVATSNRAPQELNKDLLSGFQKVSNNLTRSLTDAPVCPHAAPAAALERYSALCHTSESTAQASEQSSAAV